MAFVEVGNDQGSGSRSPIQKWNSVGQTVEGVYRGQRNGKFGPLTVVETPSGELVYGTKAVLARKLAEVSVGDRVKIEYLGKRQSENGREYGDFRVLVDKAPARPTSSPVTAARANVTAGTTGPVSEEFERLVGLIRKEKGDTIVNTLKDGVYDSVEFVRLTKLIEAEKGKVIADALAAAAKMAGDPVKSLRDAMKQVGVLEF